MSKHTPGPWEITGSKIYSNEFGLICKVFYDPSKKSSAENVEGNRQLIAAAPDLLKYLIEFERYAWNGDPRHREADTLCQRARAAIKAATDE